MQAWLIQRIIREILPFVIEGVSARMRGRRPGPAAPPPPPPPSGAGFEHEPGLRALHRQMEARFEHLRQESEARHADLAARLRFLEDRLLAAQQENTRRLQRLTFYLRLLLGWAAALNLAVLYLLLR
jgi:hypothetical protein